MNCLVLGVIGGFVGALVALAAVYCVMAVGPANESRDRIGRA